MQQVTDHGPSRHHYHVPRTTNHEPAGRTHGSAPTEIKRATSHEPQLQATSYRPQATGHRLVFSIPRPRSGARAGREAYVLLPLTRKCWNVGEGLEPYPTGQESKAGHGASTLLQATGYEPLAIPSHHTTHHVLRTTYPQGGKRVRPCDEITHITSQSHMPRATGHFITTYHVLRTTHHVPAGRQAGPPLRRDDTTRATSRNHGPRATGYLPLFRHSSQAGLWPLRAVPDRNSLRRSWTP